MEVRERDPTTDLPLIRPDICPVGVDCANVVRSRSPLVAGGRCHCCDRCCQARSGKPAGAHDQAVGVVRESHPRWRLAGCGVLFGPFFII